MKRNKEKKPKEKFVDDGRVIANMNVDGMPWYHAEAKNHETDQSEQVQLNAKETGAVMRGVTGAALLVGGVFVLGFGLVILLMYLAFA
jgi:hypothetical protein